MTWRPVSTASTEQAHLGASEVHTLDIEKWRVPHAYPIMSPWKFNVSSKDTTYSNFNKNMLLKYSQN